MTDFRAGDNVRYRLLDKQRKTWGVWRYGVVKKANNDRREYEVMTGRWPYWVESYDAIEKVEGDDIQDNV